MAEYQLKTHPLNDIWTFWYYHRHASKGADYDKHVVHIEDFFHIYCFLKKPSHVGNNHKLIFFRNKCRPLWEDWVDGAFWILSFPKKETDALNKKWENLLLGCIGEWFDEPNVIGAILNLRVNENVLEIWMAKKDEDIRLRVGEKLRVILDLDGDSTLLFQDISKSLKEHSMFRDADQYQFVFTSSTSSTYQTPLQTPGLPSKTTIESLKDEKNK